jgi:hypothetical protein
LHATNVAWCCATHRRRHYSGFRRSYRSRLTKNMTGYKKDKTNTNCIRESDLRDMPGNLLRLTLCDGHSLARFIEPLKQPPV